MLTEKAASIKSKVKNSTAIKKTSTTPLVTSSTPPKKESSCPPSDSATSQLPTKCPSSALVKQEGCKETKHPCYKTRITVKYDTGFSNQLYIRGCGGHLSWDKGELLQNVKADEWIWETDAQFTSCEFKILINDSVYEIGKNHHIKGGSVLLYTPHFC